MEDAANPSSAHRGKRNPAKLHTTWLEFVEGQENRFGIANVNKKSVANKHYGINCRYIRL